MIEIEMDSYLLTAIFTLVLGAGNSVYHGEQLVIFEKKKYGIDDTGMKKVFNILKIVLGPAILYLGYLLAKENLFLLIIGVVLNLPPINALTILIANIFVIPLSIVIAKLVRIKV